MVFEGCSTASTRSRRPNASPADCRSGPAFDALPSTEWQFEQSARTSLKIFCPRPASPSFVSACLRYASRSGACALAAIGGLANQASASERTKGKQMRVVMWRFAVRVFAQALSTLPLYERDITESRSRTRRQALDCGGLTPLFLHRPMFHGAFASRN